MPSVPKTLALIGMDVWGAICSFPIRQYLEQGYFSRHKEKVSAVILRGNVSICVGGQVLMKARASLWINSGSDVDKVSRGTDGL